MITIHYALRRKADMSFEDFSAYWRGPHATLVKSLAPQLGIVRYVQHHAMIPQAAAAMQAARGTAAPFDGVAAISFASADDLTRGNVDPASADAGSSIFFTQAHEVIA